MLSVEEARTRILAGLTPVGAEIASLAEAGGRVLAGPVSARLTQPPADVSAMDGYALRAKDGAAGSRLRVIGTAQAGHPFDGIVGAGEAVRLFTGSVIPAGADTVLLQEDAADESPPAYPAAGSGFRARRRAAHPRQKAVRAGYRPGGRSEPSLPAGLSQAGRGDPGDRR
jgi:molybdopterin molybdotransferase